MKTILIVCVFVASVAIVSTNSWFMSQPNILEDAQAMWTDCSKNKNGKGKILNIAVSPNPPQTHQPLVVNASFVLNEEVTGGKIDVKITYGIIPFKLSFKLCTLTSMIELDCPIAPGYHNITKSIDLSGAFTVRKFNSK
jgi:hypothetical protein